MRDESIRSSTDSQLSIEADEFIWNSGGSAPVHDDVREPILRLLRDWGARSVLDIGCGNGAFTSELHNAGFDV